MLRTLGFNLKVLLLGLATLGLWAFAIGKITSHETMVRVGLTLGFPVLAAALILSVVALPLGLLRLLSSRGHTKWPSLIADSAVDVAIADDIEEGIFPDATPVPEEPIPAEAAPWLQKLSSVAAKDHSRRLSDDAIATFLARLDAKAGRERVNWRSASGDLRQPDGSANEGEAVKYSEMGKEFYFVVAPATAEALGPGSAFEKTCLSLAETSKDVKIVIDGRGIEKGLFETLCETILGMIEKLEKDFERVCVYLSDKSEILAPLWQCVLRHMRGKSLAEAALMYSTLLTLFFGPVIAS